MLCPPLRPAYIAPRCRRRGRSGPGGHNSHMRPNKRSRKVVPKPVPRPDVEARAVEMMAALRGAGFFN